MVSTLIYHAWSTRSVTDFACSTLGREPGCHAANSSASPRARLALCTVHDTTNSTAFMAMLHLCSWIARKTNGTQAAHLWSCCSVQTFLITHFSQNLRCWLVTMMPSSWSTSMLSMCPLQPHQVPDAGVSGIGR